MAFHTCSPGTKEAEDDWFWDSLAYSVRLCVRESVRGVTVHAQYIFSVFTKRQYVSLHAGEGRGL